MEGVLEKDDLGEPTDLMDPLNKWGTILDLETQRGV